MTLLPTAATTAVLVAVVPQMSPETTKSVQGTVRDEATGTPIAGALVRQLGGAPAAYTDSHGEFTLTFDPVAYPDLVVSANRYVTRRQPLGKHDHHKVTLTAIAATPAPPVGRAASASGPKLFEDAPLGSNLTFGVPYNQVGYALALLSMSYFAIKDYQFAGRFRKGALMIEAEGVHSQTGFDMSLAPGTSAQALQSGDWRAGARLGLVKRWSPSFETAVQLGYRFRNGATDGGVVAPSPTAVGFNLDQHAVGPIVALGYRVVDGITLEGSAGFYPWSGQNFLGSGQPTRAADALDVRGAFLYDFQAGTRIGLAYQYERWNHQAVDAWQALTFQIRYVPED